MIHILGFKPNLAQFSGFFLPVITHSTLLLGTHFLLQSFDLRKKMEEISGCKKCRTWEEEMYWKHFNSMHFYLTLPPNFHHHLVLPQKFAVNMKDQLPDKVPVKGPSGVLWDIELLKSNYVLFVGNEWKDFVKVNDLKENNLLMFKYKSNLTFEVLIFDQGSSCERESAYFVNKCMHPKADLGGIEKKTTRKASSTEVIEDDGEEYSAFLVSKKDNEGVVCSGEKVKTPTPSPSGNDAAFESRPISKRDYSAFENEENFRVIDHSHKLKALSEKGISRNGTFEELSQILRKEMTTLENGECTPVVDCSNIFKDKAEMGPSGSSGTFKELNQISRPVVIRPDYRDCFPEGDDQCHKSHRKRGGPKKQALPNSPASAGKTSCKDYIPNKRPVTEMEKQAAFQRANQNMTEHSFIAIMRPSCVYKRFFLNVPVEWLHKHSLRHNQEVVLHVGEKTWLTTYYSYGKGQGLGPGWKKFALENFLVEFDVLVFTPIDKKDEAAMVINVDIFRVGSTIMPLPPILS